MHDALNSRAALTRHSSEQGISLSLSFRDNASARLGTPEHNAPHVACEAFALADAAGYWPGLLRDEFGNPVVPISSILTIAA